MIDFEVSINPSHLKQNNAVEAFVVGDTAPSIDITLSEFSGGKGKGYSVVLGTKFTSSLSVERGGKTLQFPSRAVVEELSGDYVFAGSQYGMRVQFETMYRPLEGDKATGTLGWGASAHISVSDGRGSSKVVYLPGGIDGEFSRGDNKPAASYTVRFEVKK